MFLILLVFIFIFGGLEDIIKQVIFFSLFVLLLLVVYNRDINIKIDFFLPFVFSFICVSSVLYTYHVWVSIYYSASILTGALFYIIIRNNDNRWKEKSILVLIGCGIFHGIAGLYQVFYGVIPGLFEIIKSPLGLFYNSNIYSGFLTPLVPLSLYLYFIKEKSVYMWVTCFLIFSNLLSNSRFGIVAMFFGLIVVSIFFAMLKEKKHFLMLILVVFIGSACYIGLQYVIPSNTGVAEKSADSFFQRIYHFQNAIKLFLNAPIIGNGIDSYRHIAPLVSISDRVEHVSHAHNIFLNILVETGLLGLLSFILFLMVIFKGKLFDKAFFFKISLMSFLFHNLMEYNFVSPIFQVLFYSLCAFIISERDAEIPSINIKDWKKRMLTVIVFVYFLTVVYPPMIGFMFLNRYKQAMENRDIKLAYQNLMYAKFFGYAVSSIHDELGSFYAEIFLYDRVKNKKFFKMAEEQYLKALRLNRMDINLQNKIKEFYRERPEG